jgi:lipopolysaccharide assembly protein B
MLVETTIAIAGVALGYLVGRLGPAVSRSGRRKRRAEEGLAYIKGVNYILSDAPDLAIEEFIKAVQINSETVETYLALGSLFRSKGDATRAVRIHQGIICRPHVDPKILTQALYELGLDYRKAGLLDRAVATFQDVVARDPKMIQAHVQLEEVFEETHEWEAAFEAQGRISKLRKSDDQHVLAHLMTEQGKAQAAKGDPKAAKSAFKKAISIDPQCVDAYLHFGDLYAEQGQDAKAVVLWKKAMEASPSMTFLAYDRLERAFFRMGQVSSLEEFLRERSSQADTDLFTQVFLARHLRKKGETEEAGRILKAVLEQWPHSREAREELIEIYKDGGRTDEALEEYGRLVRSLAQIDRFFQCRMCGYGSTKLLWKCPQCLRWDTMGSPEAGARNGGKEA